MITRYLESRSNHYGLFIFLIIWSPNELLLTVILLLKVCAYKDGKVIIDSAAGVLGEDDPRPVRPDTLFPVFSATKGITTALLHWLVDKGKVKLDENVANVWPGFGTNGKEHIKVHHVLNHTSGLHNALGKSWLENASLICDWDKCLSEIATSVPETEPGREQWYHYSSFGWLCGGVIEPFLGSHPHIPTIHSENNSTNQKQNKDVAPPFKYNEDDTEINKNFGNGTNTGLAGNRISTYSDSVISLGEGSGKGNAIRIFKDPRIHDAFLGVGEYEDMVLKNGEFGLGFKRWSSNDGFFVGFGHRGFGGSTGFCHIPSRFAVAVTVNRLSISGAASRKIIQFLSSELNIPLPEEL
ncbi:hypothetical protein Tsubulata_045359 [Turnera subulata]|uniref:Beta-lactamase-related domain-containing protein n=1 Tax=Turnera subulata TaxID=218843 RepID=A0A9Q0JGI0_9ROSI|nr:hypothetical protein Tsubulata_045359 [Turnera subulata]